MATLHQQREDRLTGLIQIVQRELARGLDWSEALEVAEKNLMHRWKMGYNARKDYLECIESMRESLITEHKAAEAKKQARIEAEANNVLKSLGANP